VAGAAGSRSARYVFPVRGCRVAYGHSHSYYPATDIFTDRGRAFVAPTDGVVDEVSRVDRWDPTSDHGVDRGGLSVSIIGIDGVRYYGSHLQSIAPGITHGARVRAGRLLGRIDNSGDARTTPTHVHFGLSWPTPAASGGSPAVWCTPGRTWMPGRPVATSRQLRRSKPPTPPPAATSPPVASAARCCMSCEIGARLQD
jgi:murein DD-endopeptidase MepM/ murein hydrolase activator NlpD